MDEYDCRDPMAIRFPDGRHLAVGDQEPVAVPLRLLPEEPPREPEVPRVLPVPSGHRVDLSVLVEPFRRGRQGHRIEPVRDREVEGGGSRKEEQVEVRMAAGELLRDGDRAGGVAESEGIRGNVPGDLRHRGPSMDRLQKTLAVPGTSWRAARPRDVAPHLSNENVAARRSFQ